MNKILQKAIYSIHLIWGGRYYNKKNLLSLIHFRYFLFVSILLMSDYSGIKAMTAAPYPNPTTSDQMISNFTTFNGNTINAGSVSYHLYWVTTFLNKMIEDPATYNANAMSSSAPTITSVISKISYMAVYNATYAGLDKRVASLYTGYFNLYNLAQQLSFITSNTTAMATLNSAQTNLTNRMQQACVANQSQYNLVNSLQTSATTSITIDNYLSILSATLSLINGLTDTATYYPTYSSSSALSTTNYPSLPLSSTSCGSSLAQIIANLAKFAIANADVDPGFTNLNALITSIGSNVKFFSTTDSTTRNIAIDILNAMAQTTPDLQLSNFQTIENNLIIPPSPAKYTVPLVAAATSILATAIQTLYTANVTSSSPTASTLSKIKTLINNAITLNSNTSIIPTANAISPTTPLATMLSTVNQAAFSIALAAAITPSQINTLVNTSAYNSVTYLVDYPSTSNCVYTAIQNFFNADNSLKSTVTGTTLTDLQTLLKNTNLAKFLTTTELSTAAAWLNATAPIANFTSSKSGLTATFTDSSTNTPTSWAWNFGEASSSSNTSTLKSPTHTYAAGGTYTVTLVSTNAGGSSTKTDTVTIATAPVANFTSSVAGLVATFTDSSTNIPTSWAWNFGDTSSASNNSTVKSPTHTYTKDGTYTVTLVATNASGSNTKTSTITISPAPVANFTSSVAGLVATFTDSSTNIPTSWDWNFGEASSSSNTSTLKSPTHAYAAGGTYTVTLVATNASGSNTKTATVTVVDPATIAATANATAFVSALTSATTPSAINTLVNTSHYNSVTYLVDYPSTTNSIYTKIQGFFNSSGTPNVTGTDLTDLQTLLSNTNLAKFLTAAEQTTAATWLTAVNFAVNALALNAALNNIGTNYTSDNLGTSSDTWPTQKTLFAIINNPTFNDAYYQGANDGDLIYTKLVGFYNNRTAIGLLKVSDGWNGLFDQAKDKAFLSDTQKQDITTRASITITEFGLTTAINTFNAATNKLAAISTFINTSSIAAKKLRAQKATLLATP